jgi:hypothetical protein
MPDSELEALMIIFVPAAVAGGTPKARRKGSRIVPNANPTKPPNSPTKKEINSKLNSFQIGKSTKINRLSISKKTPN